MTTKLAPPLLGSLARAALDNASNLLADSLVLLAAGRHPRALALAVLAAEELGKHMMCMSAVALDVDDPSTVKKFWRRFRSHDAKFATWYELFIIHLTADPSEESTPDDWTDMWSEVSKTVKVAMESKLQALYVDARDGDVTSPEQVVTEELARNAWKSISLVAETIKRQWEGADLAAFLDEHAPAVSAFRKAAIEARRNQDVSATVDALAQIVGKDAAAAIGLVLSTESGGDETTQSTEPGEREE